MRQFQEGVDEAQYSDYCPSPALPLPIQYDIDTNVCYCFFISIRLIVYSLNFGQTRRACKLKYYCNYTLHTFSNKIGNI